MDAISVFRLIENLYNSLNEVPIVNMYPFLILKRVDKKVNPEGTLYKFQQYKGDFVSSAFNLGTMQFKEFTYITPLLYFKNKRILSNIIKLTSTGKYSVFLTFKSCYKIQISLYRNDLLHIKHFNIKLFSGSFNLSLFDWFIYIFKLSKYDRLKLKIDKYKEKLYRLEEIRKTEELIESPKIAYQKTKELLKKLRKKWNEENKKKESKNFEDFYKSEIELQNFQKKD